MQSISYKSVLSILVHYDLHIVARLQILVVETLSHRHFGWNKNRIHDIEYWQYK